MFMKNRYSQIEEISCENTVSMQTSRMLIEKGFLPIMKLCITVWQTDKLTKKTKQ